MNSRPGLGISPVVRAAKPLDAHGMVRSRPGRVLYGAERERVIAEHLKSLQHRNETELETDGAPIQLFLEGRLPLKRGKRRKAFRV